VTCTDPHILIHSFLELDGVELANGSRTVQYIANGLATSNWQVQGGDCSVLYRELGCPSAAACFVSPALDPAPWYDPAFPESGDFLGLLIPDLRSWFDGLASRAVTPRASGLGGASIGPMHDDPRELVTNGVLVAANQGGIEWGRRWLQYVMGKSCDPCNLAVARLRSFCPPCDGSDDTAGEWFVYEVGLVSGVKETEPTQVGGGPTNCDDRLTVTFTLDTGNPYLYKRAETCIESSLNPEACGTDCIDFCHWLQDAPPPVQCTIEPPSIGTLASVITIDAGTGLSELTLEVLSDCSPSAALAPLATMYVPELPAGSQLVVDSALQQIIYTPAGGEPIDGTGFITLAFGQGVPWLAVGSCNPARCISVGLARICNSDCTPTVNISTRLRED
jgi:hypothetical protein